MNQRRLACFVWGILGSLLSQALGQSGERLPGTEPLRWDGDIAARLVAQADELLLRALGQSVAQRHAVWSRDGQSSAGYAASIEPNRQRLAHILGVRDEREGSDRMWLVGTLDNPPTVAESDSVRIVAVKWPVLGRIHGEGLLLLPVARAPLADIVAVPDAAQTPEMLCGLQPGVALESQYPRRLAEAGCRVLVPWIVDRELRPRKGRAELSTREYLYRSAFELGRHVIGYEIQKILAGVDWFRHTAPEGRKVGLVGWGEGGMLALYAAALDQRIDAACVSGHFQPREAIWREPIDRNVFGLLEQFGDAELASMIVPRALLIEAARGPELELVSGKGGAPGVLTSPEVSQVRAEFARAVQLVAGLPDRLPLELLETPGGQGPFLTDRTLQRYLQLLHTTAVLDDTRPAPEYRGDTALLTLRKERQVQEMDDQNQWFLRESAYVRQEFMKRLDTSSIEAYARTVEDYRRHFQDEVIGQLGCSLSAPHARTRWLRKTDEWTAYEVVLDVVDGLCAYGILLLPNDLQPGQRRPVVVCQHGLEGRPQELIEGNHRAYHDFAAALACRGFITFAPQNLYLFGDRFRTLQRKANPLKLSLFSLMVPQHQQIVTWLGSLPQVDASRIGFYGLSYGGKSAMRIPALVDGYCLSICSGDFNEWVWKNASTRAPYSYVWTGEYEIFEFDLGSTFNYAEMAALIAPRPFMVERGHFDTVAPDEKVAHEFAKVRRLYAAHLKIPERCAIEWFVGPHAIHGQGTFQFLHEQLHWPGPPGQ